MRFHGVATSATLARGAVTQGFAALHWASGTVDLAANEAVIIDILGTLTAGEIWMIQTPEFRPSKSNL